MKKITAILLVLFFVVGSLPLTGVAASPPSTVLGFSVDDVVDNSNVEDFGALALGSDITTLILPIKWENFQYEDGIIDPAEITEDIKNRMYFTYEPNNSNDTKTFEDLFAAVDEKHHNTVVGTPQFVFTPKNIGAIDGTITLHYIPDPSKPNPNFIQSRPYPIKGRFVDPTNDKKIVGLTGLNMATESKYVALNDEIIWTYSLQEDYDPNADPRNPQLSSHQEELLELLSNLEIKPGDELSFGLHTDHFVWQTPIDKMRSSVRKSTLDNYSVNSLKLLISGDDIIDTVGFENRTQGSAAYVVTFKDDFGTVKDRDFVYDLSLGFDSRRDNDSAVRISGTYSNDEFFAGEDVDKVFLGDGTVLEPDAPLKNVHLDLDNGVTLVANLAKGKRYYGISRLSLSKDDKDIMNYFISIKKAITLTTTNLETAVRYVLLEEETPYFVYDADGKYIGMSYEQLPYRTKYYLSTKELSVEEETVTEELIAPEEITEGDGLNPSTGMSGLTTIMNLVGVGSLLVGGLLLGSKKMTKTKKEEELS